MNYLGLDYGLKYLGVAFSDGSLATPLTRVFTSKALSILPAIIDKHNVKAIIIGIPDGPVAISAHQFVKSLQFLGLPIHQVDETLSSHDARTRLLHTTQTRRRSLEHAASAAVILQSWLDATPTPL